MAGLKLTWFGKKVNERAKKAAQLGIDATLAAATNVAQDKAPRLTGALANNITYQPATIQGARVVGYFGNWVTPYALWQELNNRSRPNFLRGAADQEYPKLADRVRDAWKGL